MRLARQICLLTFSVLLSEEAAAQACPPHDVAALDSLAQRAFAGETKESVRSALSFWRCAEAQVLFNISRAMNRLGVRDSALRYLGRASALKGDTAVSRTAARLIESSPVLEPTRDVAGEIAFVSDVHALLSALPGGTELLADTRSVDDAMAVLEAISEERTATLRLSSPHRGFPVDIRRWTYRKSRTIPWMPIRADTVITVPAVMYQFRYRPPGAQRDTIIDVPCADACVVRLPRD